MSRPRDLRLVAEEPVGAAVVDTGIASDFDLASPPEPVNGLGEALSEAAVPAVNVFVRSLAIAPALPWEQSRMAALEARASAPLPLSEVMYRVRRLEAWRPGRPGRYAAFYIRAAEAAGGHTAEVNIDGQRLKVDFVSAREQARRARRAGSMALAAVLAGLILSAAVGSALAVRADGEARLAALEQAAANRLKQAKGVQRQRLETRALDGAGMRGRALTAVLSDLAWASTAKAPDAHIDAFHWDRDYFAVVVRGETPPFTGQDRRVERADKPLRRGVWMWGVAPVAETEGRP